LSSVAGQLGVGRRRAWRHAASLTASFSLLGLVAGCTHYQAAPVKLDQTVDTFAARRLSEPQLRDNLVRLLPETAAKWPLQEWDRAELLAVALTQNPQLAVARVEVQTALSREITAAQTPNPDLTLQSEYARHDPHPWLYGLYVDWLLRPKERRRLETEAARRDTGNVRWQLMDQAWAVRSALAVALSDGENAHRRLVLLGRLAAAQDRFIEIERRRVQAGEDSPAEMVTSQQVRLQIEQEEADQRASENAAQGAAAKVLGLPPQALDGVVVTWPDWGDPPPLATDDLLKTREQALLSRADLAAAIDTYAAAEARLQLSIARQYPQLTLSPGYYWDHGIAKFPFDVGFTVPFNRNRGEIAEAHADRELAGQRMLALQADIYGQIEAALRAERIARQSADAAERQLQAARRQKEQIDLGLRLGSTDVQEQIGAEIFVTRAELEVVQLRAQLQASRNNLEEVLHAPLSGPELAIAESLPALATGSGS
jgi:outer membrane protein, heavy metal efflux system